MEKLLEVPITYDLGDAHDPTHAPMTHATLEGIPTKVILDTGSSEHILMRRLIDQAGLAVQPGEAGTDSAGASVESWTVESVSAQIGRRAFTWGSAVVIDGPPMFADHGIGAILSPQKMEPGATAVLDMAGSRFFLVAGEWTDVSDWLRSTFPHAHFLVLEQADAGEGELLVHAAIDGFDPVVTLLDTGGKTTQFSASALPGLEVGERISSGRGVGGTESFGHAVSGQTLVVGAARLPIPRLIVGGEFDDRRGLVGMDLLRGTVLAVSGDRDQPVAWLLSA